MIYGKKIKRLRKEKKLTQEDVAKILGIGRRTYSKYENEVKFIPITLLNVLANFYKVSLDYIFGFTKTPNYDNVTKEINIETISARLKEICKKNEIKQDALALTLHISQGTVSQYINGKTLIPLIHIYGICKEYHISADYLLGKTN